MKVLVTGGAGYIGSVTVRRLFKEGHQVTVVDTLEKGHREALPGDIDLVVADIGDRERMKELFSTRAIDGIIHLAAYVESGESMERPLDFFENNLAKSIIFLQEAVAQGVNWLVFSSTAGVYGETGKLPLKETSPIEPTSYYSWSKYFFEEILKSAQVYGLRSIVLRYFNAAGATRDGELGEDKEPATHLIPLVFKTALGKQKEVVIHGDDYPTPDGTGIRDYVHVVDLAEAHILALSALAESKQGFRVYNVGTGKGSSVKEVIEMVGKVTGQDIAVRVGPKRPGDWAAAYADASKIQKELGWEAKYDLEEIMKTDWQWFKTHPYGFTTT